MVAESEGRAEGARARVRPAHLLALLPAVMLLLLLRRAVWDVDIFWQLKLGEMILDRGGPVRLEPFAALHLGEPLPAVAWAGQAVMALARQIGGWNLLRITDALIWLGGFWAVAAACRQRGAATGAVALALLLALIVALPTASVRPQSFSCLCFGLMLALLRLQLAPRLAIPLGAAVLLAWQNLHPSVSVGVVAMGLAALPGWIAWLRDRARPLPLTPTALALIGACAMFATPDGFSILRISAVNAEASVAIGASEWLPLWISANRSNAIPMLVVLLLTLRHMLFNRSRVDAAEVAVALGMLVMTVAAYRFVLYWGVALIPVIARAAAAPVEDRPGRAGLLRVAVPVLIIALATPLILPTRFVETLPIGAVERLRKEGLRGTVYGDFPFGGVIIDTGYPDWRVAYDGRYYRYARKEWQYNGGIENGIVPLVDVERKWRPVAFVIDEFHNAPLAEELARARRWKRIYERGGVVVYVPRYRRTASSRPLSSRASPGSAPR